MARWIICWVWFWKLKYPILGECKKIFLQEWSNWKCVWNKVLWQLIFELGIISQQLSVIFRCSFRKCLQQTNRGCFFFLKSWSESHNSEICCRSIQFQRSLSCFVWFQFEFSVHKILSQESVYSFWAYRMYTVRTGEELSVKSVFFVPIW